MVGLCQGFLNLWLGHVKRFRGYSADHPCTRSTCIFIAYMYTYLGRGNLAEGTMFEGVENLWARLSYDFEVN